MSIWTNLIDRATGVRVRNGFQRTPLTVDLTHSARPNYERYSEEHELVLRLVATYRIDGLQAQMPEVQSRSREAAMRNLRATLYGDLLRLQAELFHAIEDGDQDEARRLCLDLRQEIIG